MTSESEPLTDEERIALVGRAHRYICELCCKEREWIMSVPARPDEDVDLVLTGALHEQERTIRQRDERIRELEAEVERQRGFRDGHPDMCCGQCVEENARLRRELDEAQSILATTADRLNTALRESGCGEILGSPYNSFAIRDGVADLYHRATKWRVERDEARAALRSEADHHDHAARLYREIGAETGNVDGWEKWAIEHEEAARRLRAVLGGGGGA